MNQISLFSLYLIFPIYEFYEPVNSICRNVWNINKITYQLLFLLLTVISTNFREKQIKDSFLFVRNEQLQIIFFTNISDNKISALSSFSSAGLVPLRYGFDEIRSI